MKIKFITSNINKFEEISEALKDTEVEQISLDLAEKQSLNAEEVIDDKLKQAMVHLTNSESDYDGLIVEDTSLYLECLESQLPGPLIKWFVKALNPIGISELVKKTGQNKAFGITLIGYANRDGQINFFSGRDDGIIVAPRGEKDFGWGPIFEQNSSGRTYGEMERSEKQITSMRGIAAAKLKVFLEKK